jgi:hypothetical protein
VARLPRVPAPRRGLTQNPQAWQSAGCVAAPAPACQTKGLPDPMFTLSKVADNGTRDRPLRPVELAAATAAISRGPRRRWLSELMAAA